MEFWPGGQFWPYSGQIFDFCWQKNFHILILIGCSCKKFSAMKDRHDRVVGIYLLIAVSILKRRHGTISYKGRGPSTIDVTLTL